MILSRLIFVGFIVSTVSLIEAQYEEKKFNYTTGDDTCLRDNYEKNQQVFLKISLDKITGQSVDIKIFCLESIYFIVVPKIAYSQRNLSYGEIKDYFINFDNCNTGNFYVCFDIIVDKGHKEEPQPITWKIVNSEEE